MAGGYYYRVKTTATVYDGNDKLLEMVILNSAVITGQATLTTLFVTGAAAILLRLADYDPKLAQNFAIELSTAIAPGAKGQMRSRRSSMLRIDDSDEVFHITADAGNSGLASLLIDCGAYFVSAVTAFDSKESEEMAKQFGPLLVRKIKHSLPIFDPYII